MRIADVCLYCLGAYMRVGPVWQCIKCGYVLPATDEDLVENYIKKRRGTQKVRRMKPVEEL